MKVAANRRHLGEFVERLGTLKSEIVLSPSMLGLLEWPYLHNAWQVPDRLDAVATHYELLQGMETCLRQVDGGRSLLLANLGFMSEGVSVVVDRAPWFIREGELVLNLFLGDLRIASIAFALGRGQVGPKIMVGAIQGIHSGVSSEESLRIYKEFTKTFEGVRPRSLLIDILRSIARHVGAVRIDAVADEHRHHRHPYFGKRAESKLGTNYNEIWLDHGGVADAASGFFHLSIYPVRKDLSEVPSKKRAMYRRRQEMLAGIERLVSHGLQGGGHERTMGWSVTHGPQP